MNIFKSKFFLIILFFLVFVGLILGFKYFLIVSSPRNSLTSFDAPINESVKNAENIENQECITKTEEHIVRGDSLSGIIEPGQTIRVLVNYYNCNKLKNGDIVIYNYAGSADPLIKIVKAVSGDSFKLQQSGNGWNILINAEIAKNSKGEPYVLNDKGYRMLSLYEKDYKGIIPADACLLLGNVASGSLDSSRFGLVSKNDILGKVDY